MLSSPLLHVLPRCKLIHQRVVRLVRHLPVLLGLLVHQHLRILDRVVHERVLRRRGARDVGHLRRRHIVLPLNVEQVTVPKA